ncbi:receptor activity-modifying protein 3-like isoform X2 [Hyla sarda]|uniref:receptor activity-modifying protein 3-like isoform X2 n=1 Tax=Hyla sarda TaxID=327740 RepID=UPI0024C3AEEA|nr:receptor activity-modifying protein 3-like isoform X2 [Hyla sarda]
METNMVTGAVMVVSVKGSLEKGFIKIEHKGRESGLQHPVLNCNETVMMDSLPICGDLFEMLMIKVDPSQWCNLTKIITYYDTLSNCAEITARNGNCFWPNNLAERFIIGIHTKFFANCTLDTVILEDPPDDILTALILIPVFLTAAMISLVVWCSKGSDIFG